MSPGEETRDVNSRTRPPPPRRRAHTAPAAAGAPPAARRRGMLGAAGRARPARRACEVWSGCVGAGATSVRACTPAHPPPRPRRAECANLVAGVWAMLVHGALANKEHGRGELAMQVCEQRPCVWVLLVNKCVCCCASSDNVLAATTLGGVGRRRPGCHVSVYLFFAFSRTRSGIHAPIQPQQQQQQHDWQCWPRDARDKRRRCTAAPRNALVRRAAAVPHCTSGDALAMRTALPWRLRSAGARAAALHASAGACGSGASSRAGRHVQRRADATHRLPPRRAVMSAAGASCTSRATVSPSCAGG